MKAALIDTETTGLIKPEPVGLDGQPEITEIYIQVLEEQGDRLLQTINFSTFVCPQLTGISADITRLTGITNEDVANAPMFAAIYPALCNTLLGVDMLVAHNCPFDAGMLELELRRIDCQYKFPWPPLRFCTAEKSEEIFGRRLPLDKLYKQCTGKDMVGHHRAKEDVVALQEIFEWMASND